MESILTTIKEMLGITADYEHFDKTIIANINTVLFTLNQIGVGPKTVPSIKSKDDTWTSTLGDMSDIEAVKTYIYLKVRMLFDPPSSSFVLDAMNRQANELEWRLNVQVDKPTEEIQNGD